MEKKDPDGRHYWDETWAVGSYLPDINFSGDQYREGCRWALNMFARLGRTPNICGVSGVKGIRNNAWRLWDEKVRKKLESDDFKKIKLIRILDALEPDVTKYFQYSNLQYIARCSGEHGSFQNAATLILRPAEVGVNWSEAAELFCEFARLHVLRYGFAFRLAETLDAECFAEGGFYGHYHHLFPDISQRKIERLPIRDPEESEAGWWLQYYELVAPQTLLRNVFMLNFLTERYLELKIGKQSLREWILADDSRGRLDKINDSVTLWTPVWENITKLREQLFRAGHIFYYRFFQTWEKDNPWKRDFSKPWKCPDEIPRIFQADYRHAIDPINLVK